MVDANLPRGVDALSVEDLKSYKKNSHLCRRTDRALAKEITDTITVRNERLDWLEKCENSGLRLIPLLFARDRANRQQRSVFEDRRFGPGRPW